MRALAFVSIIAGFAVVLMPSAHRSSRTEIQAEQPVLASHVGVELAGRFAPQVRPMGDRGPEDPKHDVIAADATPVDSGKLVPRLNHAAMGSIADAAKRSPDDSVVRVPGQNPASKAHAEAIASIIDSEESKVTVEPLARLYFAYFNRFPDYEGLDYYIGEREGGTPLESIADEFARSREFDLRYGSVDNAAFVDRVYENIFGTAPDAAQRDYWIGQLDSGMTRGQVMVAFSEGSVFNTLTANEVFVAMAYVETLQRTPDPVDFVRWVNFLDAGNPRDAVIDGLLATRQTR